MNYEKIRQNHRQFEALTSLRVEEFDQLLPVFEYQYQKEVRKKTSRGTVRLNKIPDDKDLVSIEEKLFFITTYLKLNPLQEHHAASFNISQPKVSRLLRKLLKVFNDTLEQMGYMPCRNASDLNRFIEQRRGQDKQEHFFVDASERGVQRPGNPSDQEDYYSGKKKA